MTDNKRDAGDDNIRALGPVVDLASFFIETWRCDLCDDLFHRFDLRQRECGSPRQQCKNGKP